LEKRDCFRSVRAVMERGQADRGKITKKRKAESQDNDRLSKRLSLLNLGIILVILITAEAMTN